jgi:hypothetical protein
VCRTMLSLLTNCLHVAGICRGGGGERRSTARHYNFFLVGHERKEEESMRIREDTNVGRPIAKASFCGR